MTLSPFEVERQEFGHSMMGYKRREVDAFLDEVRNTLVGLWQERGDLREENERLGERVARYTALEDQLKNTLLLAQDSAERACEQARRESELVMREAGQKSREIVHAAHEERQRLDLALRELQSAEQESRQRFRAIAQTVLAHLDESDPTGETGSFRMPLQGDATAASTAPDMDAPAVPKAVADRPRSFATTDEGGSFEPIPPFTYVRAARDGVQADASDTNDVMVDSDRLG